MAPSSDGVLGASPGLEIRFNGTPKASRGKGLQSITKLDHARSEGFGVIRLRCDGGLAIGQREGQHACKLLIHKLLIARTGFRNRCRGESGDHVRSYSYTPNG